MKTAAFSEFRLWQLCKVRLLLGAASFLVRSWRIRWESTPPPPGCVIGLWHQDLPACLAAFRAQNIAVLISQSRDGDLFAALAEGLGYQVFRGSSSRGQQALRHLLRALRAGRAVGMALDGPRGPAHAEKPGAKWLAQNGHAHVARVQVRYTRFTKLHSWDRTSIPWPFATIIFSVKTERSNV